ncbi:MAG: S49 family peptidase [Gammaproteobacteria bacterium]|nr:S49 family peptidase [Gammaproteobacteria bacterium]
MADNNTERDGDHQDRGRDWERDLIERLAFAALNEQRRARRWGIFFKLLVVALVIGVIVLSEMGSWSKTALVGRYTALVRLDGAISANSQASAANVISGLRAAFASQQTAGVIVSADSPGGSPVQAADIYNAIRRLRRKYPKIPLYAVIGDECASGCYYAVAGAKKIYASPASIVGSIGVLINGFGFVDAMHKLGVERRLLTAGQYKGMLDPFSPLSPKERGYALAMLREIHHQFIHAVEQGRGKALKVDSKNLFSGLFWTGEDARKLGLIDGFGTTRYVARKIIGARHIEDFTVQQNFFDRVAGRIGTSIAQRFEADLLQPVPSLR